MKCVIAFRRVCNHLWTRASGGSRRPSGYAGRARCPRRWCCVSALERCSRPQFFSLRIKSVKKYCRVGSIRTHSLKAAFAKLVIVSTWQNWQNVCCVPYMYSFWIPHLQSRLQLYIRPPILAEPGHFTDLSFRPDTNM